MNNAVVIIAYSANPTDLELSSFKQCLCVLSKYDIFVVCPRSMATGRYDEICSQCGIRVRYEQFDDAWFASIESYNRLMLSSVFYERFLPFKYILLYQLDAWVFSDQLEQWCQKGYDYIGAPWFTDRGELFPFAGNGGFSLRNVHSCFDLLTKNRKRQWNYPFFFTLFPDPSRWRQYNIARLHFLTMLRCRLSTPRFFQQYEKHEDFAFAMVMSAIKEYHVAPPEVAMFFSFERFPEQLYQLTDCTLPFGAHAVSRYSPDFWSQWIAHV